MGHVPSREFCREPFYIFLESGSAAPERLALVALTSFNFIGIQGPLFQKLQEARVDPSVRYWYATENHHLYFRQSTSASPSESEVPQEGRRCIPPTPDAEFLFQKFIRDADEIYKKDLEPEDFVPMPVVLLRMNDPTSQVLNYDNATIVGYFGLRHFGSNGVLGPHGVAGVFLNRFFYNEAKSSVVMAAAAKCYQVFCRRAMKKKKQDKEAAAAAAAAVRRGAAECATDVVFNATSSSSEGDLQVPWPKVARFATLRTNLPCLRLLQKIYLQCQQQHSSGGNGTPFVKFEYPVGVKGNHDNDGPLTMKIEGERVIAAARGGALLMVCDYLASKVKEFPLGNGNVKYTIRVDKGVQGGGGGGRRKEAPPPATATAAQSAQSAASTATNVDQPLRAAQQFILNQDSESLLDSLVQYAKDQWKESNAPVLEARLASGSASSGTARQGAEEEGPLVSPDPENVLPPSLTGSSCWSGATTVRTESTTVGGLVNRSMEVARELGGSGAK